MDVLTNNKYNYTHILFYLISNDEYERKKRKEKSEC